jgi:hypothetical protein
LLCTTLITATLACLPLAAGFDHEHALWTEVLEERVQGDRFDYAGLKGERKVLDRYLAQLHAVTPAELDGWTREQQYAFWINTYNAHAVDLVARNWPVKSIKDIGGFFSPVWDKEFIPMRALHPQGKRENLSLDDIEHLILRPRFRDARVHAAVNCASIGCPPLRAEAYVAARLDAQLDEQVRGWLADPARNRYDRSESTIRVSEIFKWFDEDFERDAGSVEAWIQRYAPPEEAAWMRSAKKLRRKYVDYDWKVNALRQSPARKP